MHDEAILVGFVVLNNAKQRKLEFRYNFLGRIMRPKTFRATEMDTDALFMTLRENSLYECLNDMAKTDMKEKDNFYLRQRRLLSTKRHNEFSHSFMLSKTFCTR